VLFLQFFIFKIILDPIIMKADNCRMNRLYSLLILACLSCVTRSEIIHTDKVSDQKPVAVETVNPEQLTSKYAGIIDALKAELKRGMKIKIFDYPSPYFISYLLKDSENLTISASNGAVMFINSIPQRTVYTEVRVGSYEFDSSISKGDAVPYQGGDFYSMYAPLDDNYLAMRRVLWLLTDQEYKQAVSGYLSNKAKNIYKVEKDAVPSFSRESPVKFVGYGSTLELDKEAFKERMRWISARFIDYPDIIESEVRGDFRKKTTVYVNSEGSEILTQSAVLTIYINAETKADDGMTLSNFRMYSIRDIKNLPSDEQILKDIEQIVEELRNLKNAQEMQPYTGPAILSAEVAGVFFHEVLGHRLEGERQKDEREGMTFSDKVGTRVLPEFLTVIDDPTIQEFNGIALTGHYLFDDEGVPARRVELIKDGILKNFLLSRTPIKGFLHSNGHGRNDSVQKPMGRMGNFIIQSSLQKTKDELVEMLIEECKKQGKPYGFIIERASAGETNTSRYGFQAFKGVPLLVYRVYTVDGHKELVRGVEIVGTPLTVLNKILATGNDQEVFNGYCGAESGFIPVSVVAPSILVSEIELQKTSQEKSRPPILPPPK